MEKLEDHAAHIAQVLAGLGANPNPAILPVDDTEDCSQQNGSTSG